MMWKEVILKLAFTLMISGIQYPETTDQERISQDCVSVISETYFQRGETVVLSPALRHYENFEIYLDEWNESISVPKFSYSSDNGLLRDIHRTMDWKVVILPLIYDLISHKFYSVQMVGTYDAYIFLSDCVGDDYVSIVTQIALLTFLHPLNARARYILVLSCLRNRVDSEEVVKRLLNYLGYYNIYDAIVLVPTETGMMDIYSWFPFDKDSGDCAKLKSIVLLDSCIPESEYPDLIFHADLFPEKITENLQQCAITVSTAIYPPYVIEKYMPYLCHHLDMCVDGLEPQLIKILANRLNASVIFLQQPKNTSLDSLAAHLNDARANILIGNIMYDDHFNYFYEFTVPHSADTYTWYVPLAEPYPRWKGIIRVFKIDAWCVLLAFILISAVTAKKFAASLPEVCVKEYWGYHNIANCVSYNWCALLGFSVPLLPGTTPLRLFFYSWVVFSFALNIIFQTYVTSYFVNPGRLHQINTLDEVIESDLEVMLSDRFFDYANYSGMILGRETTAWFENDVHILMKLAFETPDIAVLSSAAVMAYTSEFDLKQRRSLHPLKDYSLQFDSTMLVPKGWPFLPKINGIMRKLVEAGIPGKIMGDILEPGGHPKRVYRASQEYSPMSVLHLQAAFLLLALGLGISFFVFLMEVVYSKKPKHDNPRSKIQRQYKRRRMLKSLSNYYS